MMGMRGGVAVATYISCVFFFELYMSSFFVKRVEYCSSFVYFLVN
jgi:hypothetical protein